MGNAQLLPRQDNNTVQITDSLVQEFQKHVTLVDHAVTGLAKGIDVMTSTYKLILEPIDEDKDKLSDITKGSGGLETIILKTINENIRENKAVMIEAVRDLLNLTVDSFDCHINTINNVPVKLAVNTYCQINQNVSANEMEFRKKSVEVMKREISFLESEIDVQKQEIDVLKKKENYYIKEIKQLRVDFQSHAKTNDEDQRGIKKITTDLADDLEKSISIEKERHKQEKEELEKQIKIEKERHKQEQEELETQIKIEKERHKQEKEELETQIKSLNLQLEILNSKNVIHVQLFRSKNFTAMPAEDELMSYVKEHLELNSISLITRRCTPQNLNKNRILLISCEHISVLYGLRHSKTLQTAIKDVKGICNASKVAVIIFYRRNEKELRKELEQNSDDSLGLGGVFHVGHSGSLYKCGLNDVAIEGIVDFIVSVGEKTKTYADTPV